MFGRIVQGIDTAKFDHVLDEAKERGRRQARPGAEPTTSFARSSPSTRRSSRPRPAPTSRPTRSSSFELAIQAVFGSWMGKRAVDYRRAEKLPDDWGTAVNVQTMVFGNMGDDSGTGVAFTRDPNTGENTLYGNFLANAQGEDVVAGIRNAEPISAMREHNAGRLRAVRQDRGPAREDVPRHAGSGVHRRARQALHAPDPQRQADGTRRRQDRARTWKPKG